MKKLLLFTLMVHAAFAVGTIQQSFTQIGNSGNWVLAITWTGDITGSVPATQAQLGGAPVQGFRVYSVEIAPGTPVPSNNYNVTLTTFLGDDILLGNGKNLSNVTATAVSPPVAAPPLNGTLTINVTNNTVPNAQGRILVYFAPIQQVVALTVGAPALPTTVAAGNTAYCADASGSTTTYTCPVPVPVVTSLNGLFVNFVPQTTNTSTSTLNVASLGAKTLKQADGATNVAAGALVGGQSYFFTYNGVNFIQSNSNITTSTQLTDTANIVYTNQARTMAALLSVPGGDLFNGGVNATTGTTYTVAASDDNKLVTFNNAGAVAVTQPQAGSAGFGSGFFYFAFNRGAGTATITPTASTINGGSSLVIAQGQGALIESDGSNYSAWVSSSPTTASSAVVVNTPFSATPAFACPSSVNGTVVYFTLMTTLTASITGTFSGCTPGSTIIIKFVQDGTGTRTAAITNADSFFINPAANSQTMCVFTLEDSTHLKTDGCVSTTGYSAGQEVAAPGTPPSTNFYTWGDNANHLWCYKGNNSATVSCTVIASSAPANQFATGITAGGAVTYGAISAAAIPAVTLNTGTSRTVANQSEMFICTGTCTVTPLVPAAGTQLCVQNDDNIATTITLTAITGVQYENTARTSYKNANTTLASSGVVKDQICVVGKDATHYNVWSSVGSWN